MIGVRLLVERIEQRVKLDYVAPMISYMLLEVHFIIEKNLQLVELLVVQNVIKVLVVGLYFSAIVI